MGNIYKRYIVNREIVKMSALRKHFPENVEVLIVRTQTHLVRFEVFKVEVHKDILLNVLFLLPSDLCLYPFIAYPTIILFTLFYSKLLRSAFDSLVFRQIICSFNKIIF